MDTWQQDKANKELWFNDETHEVICVTGRAQVLPRLPYVPRLLGFRERWIRRWHWLTSLRIAHTWDLYDPEADAYMAMEMEGVCDPEEETR